MGHQDIATIMGIYAEAVKDIKVKFFENLAGKFRIDLGIVHCFKFSNGWVCMNMDENSMNYVHLTDDKLLGSYQWKGGLDLLNIILIGIANEVSEHDDDKYELHRLLSTLLSIELSVDEKLGIMEKEYSIQVDDRIREDVNAMCNLSQGIKDNTLVDVIMNMYENDFTFEQIAVATKKVWRKSELSLRKGNLYWYNYSDFIT